MATPSPFTPVRSYVLPAAGACVLAVLVVMNTVAPTDGLKGYWHRAKPQLAFGEDRITKRNAAFLRLGLLKLSHEFCPPEALAADSPEALGLYGRPCPAPPVERLQRDMPPSTALLPPKQDVEKSGVVVVSIVCRSDHLFGPKGIVANPMDRGRTAERPAWLTARRGSEILAETTIGLRIHGGFSRKTPHQSFRLVFRESYSGHSRSAPGLFFGPDTPAAREIVLVNATDPGKFRGALGTEIAALIGCHTSRVTPALLVLNGTMVHAPFFLYQHQSAEFVQDRFGIPEVEWVRVKPTNTQENAAYVKWRQWIRKERFPTVLQDEADRYDIMDLSCWALTMSFTSTADNSQGGYFLDPSGRKAPWRSLVWDMDCAFTHDVPRPAVGPYIDDRDPFAWLLGDRARLFHRLIERSPEYREMFRRFAHEKLRSAVPREKLMALADRYLELAKSHPGTSPAIQHGMEDARQFLATRHDQFLQYLDRELVEAERAQPRPVELSGAN